MAEISTWPRQGQERNVWGEIPSLTRRIEQHRAEHGHPPMLVGETPKAGDLCLNHNDYLALSQESRIVDAQIAALREDDGEIFMSGVYVQFLDRQRAFEREVATFLGAESAVVCQSGYNANEGLIQCLADGETPVYIDFYGHASLWEGAQSGGAPSYPFRHNSAEHLRTLIRRYGPGVVAVDAIYSTLGSICNLAEIADVCDETGCLLVVDESHSIGICGTQGEGLVSALGMAERVPYRAFSLSKALIGRGGMVLGPERVTDFFRFESRPAIFSSAVLPWEIARFSKTLEIVREEHHRRIRVQEMANDLRGRLADLGYNVDSSQSQIIPLEAGSEANTAKLRDALEEEGIFGAIFCPPATPRNRSLLRLCVHMGLTAEDIDRVVGACGSIRDRVGLRDWPSTKRRRAQARTTPELSIA
jgi:CAI-1 autoinducer synthase